MSFKKAFSDFLKILKPYLPPEEKTAVFVVETIVYSFLKTKKEVPERIYTPPIKPFIDKGEDEILFFFESYPSLKKAFRIEIASKDIKTLKRYFRYLYPAYELEDDYALFLIEGAENPKEIFKIIKKNRKKLRDIAKKALRSERRADIVKALKDVLSVVSYEFVENREFREKLIEIIRKI